MELFDPELYLRLVGERMLVSRSDRSRMRQDALARAADALIAVGAVESATAHAVLDEYELARALRNENEFRHRVAFNVPPPAADERAARPAPWRVVPTDATIEHAWGTEHVRYVSLSPTTTSVGVTYLFDRSRQSQTGHWPRGPMGRPGMPWGGRPRQVTLTDDRGQRISAGFHGGGGDSEWNGQLSSDRPLAPETAWIELDGNRIDLADSTWPCSIGIEELPSQPPAHRYLWELLADPVHGGVETEDLKPVIDALVAAGALDRDDPALRHVRAVAEHGWRGVQGPPNPAIAPGELDGAPDEWRALLGGARARHDGPHGRIALGALTPAFEGVKIAVIELESHADHFQLEVEVEGDVRHRARGPFRWGWEAPRLLWWARDDRGGHYLGGSWGRWSGGSGHSQGEIHFWPPLDPRARTLALMPTIASRRAVIEFELPWGR